MRAFRWIFVAVLLGFVVIELLHFLDIRARDSWDVISIASDYVDDENDGKFVVVSGDLISDESIVDELVGATLEALLAKRHVSTFQWDEASYSSQGAKRLYRPVWSTGLLPSFVHQEQEFTNPEEQIYLDKDFQVTSLRIGTFEVDMKFLTQLNNYTSQIEFEEVENRFVLQDKKLYSGDPIDPEVGDTRILYEAVLPWVHTILAKQMGNYLMFDEQNEGPSILPGERSSDDFFVESRRVPLLIVWIFRIASCLGILLMSMRLGGIYKAILHVPAKKIPDSLFGVMSGFLAWWTLWGCFLLIRDPYLVVVGYGFFFLVLFLIWLFYEVGDE